MNETIDAYLYDDPAAHSEEFDRTLLRSIQEASPDGILVVDGDARVVSYIQQFLRIWGIPAERLVARDAQDGIHDTPVLLKAAQRVRDPEGFISRVRELYANRSARDHCEIELKDGRTLERHSVGMLNESGKYLGRVWFFRDISMRKRDEAVLRHLASHDALTGILNRAGFFEVAGKEISCTVSGGLVMLNSEDENIDSVLLRADKALYRAKAGGRNRIETAPA